MTDIIDKLRALGTGYVGTTRGHTATLMNEAADVIEALRAENEKLRELLEVVWDAQEEPDKSRWITARLSNEWFAAAGKLLGRE